MRNATLALLGILLPVWLGCSPEPAVETPSAQSAKKQTLTSSTPPGGLSVRQVPQFVQFGFDDNAISGRPGSGTDGGLTFVTDLFAGRRNPAGKGNPRTFDGQSARFSFYVVTRNIEESGLDTPVHVKRQWRAAVDAGHEIGLHTHSHPHGGSFTSEQWLDEIEACRSWLTKPFDSDRAAESDVGIGVETAELAGFRAPYLEHGKPLFPALRQAGLAYDCSIQEGFQDAYDGTNLPWPYRIEAPGDEEAGSEAASELWEIPAYIFVVPPDSECEKYGVRPGLRARLAERHDYFDPDTGKITGFDWNLWVEFGMTRAEVVATVTYSLDLRMAGNRAPLTFGTHSDIYSSLYSDDELPTTAADRQRALEEILDYALSKPEVRVVSARQILDWVRNPVSL